MRILYYFVLLILFNRCKTSTNVLTTKIIEVEDIERPITKEAYHENDVKVFRSREGENHMLYALTLIRYNKEDTLSPYLKLYLFGIVSLNTYETAEYERINDSTVTFFLKNKFHIEGPYTLSGYGGTTSGSMDE